MGVRRRSGDGPVQQGVEDSSRPQRKVKKGVDPLLMATVAGLADGVLSSPATSLGGKL